MKSVFLNILMMIASLVFCLLLGEAALRIVKPTEATKWHDRPAFYYVPKGSENLQGNIYQKEKPEGVYRIAVVGDSFTFAPFMQYDDSFSARLERMLNLNGGNRKVEVINYGVPGFSSTHEVPLVKQAIAEKADLVLLQITLNDPEKKPYQPAGITIRQNDQGAIVVDKDSSNGWFAAHSKLYQFLFGRVSTYKMGKSYEQYFFDLYEDKSAMQGFVGAITQMRDMTKENNVRMAAVVFPLFGSKLDDSYPFHGIHTRIGQILDELRIERLDLEAPYRGIPAERLQVMPGEDFHPNEIGHRIAAENIFCWFKSKKLVPDEFEPSTLWKQRAQLRFPSAGGKGGNNSSSTFECP